MLGRTLRWISAAALIALIAACSRGEEPDESSEAAVTTDRDCDHPNARLSNASALSRWQGLSTDLGPKSFEVARWMAWFSAVAYVDDFGDLDDPGYVFRCGFHRMGYGSDRSGTYDLAASNGRRVRFSYANEGELWWNAGAELKALVRACPAINAVSDACVVRDAVEKDLFTHLPASRAIGKLHGQRLRGLGRFDQGTTQVFFLHDPDRNHAVVAFRGTQTTVAEDILADLNVLPVDIGGAKVHAGFHNALHEETTRGRSASDILLARLDQLPRGTDVYLTGHSLGGALATLFAEEILARRGRPYTLRGLYTFGAPAAGDRAFGDRLNAGLRSEDAWHGRFTHGRDVVPALTYFTFSYVHNTERDANRHAQGINLDCGGSGYTITEERRASSCVGPIADHDINGYFSALSEVARRSASIR